MVASTGPVSLDDCFVILGIIQQCLADLALKEQHLTALTLTHASGEDAQTVANTCLAAWEMPYLDEEQSKL